MSSQETMHVSLIKVTPISGKGTLGTWWCHWIARCSDTVPGSADAGDDTKR
jgi:hypothetical protein